MIDLDALELDATTIESFNAGGCEVDEIIVPTQTVLALVRAVRAAKVISDSYDMSERLKAPWVRAQFTLKPDELIEFRSSLAPFRPEST